ncbi:MAG: DNA translocase FtsK [Bacteriovoracaceae bacterium]
MEKKLLRIQLITLFTLSILNLLYFYFRDSLPDHFFEINSTNSSINFFSYYLISFIANFGYWTGLWVVVSFFVFAGIFYYSIQKRNDWKRLVVFLALIPLTVLLGYMLFPLSLGDGLFFFLRENLTTLYVALSFLFFATSFFYLVSEKHFFQTVKWLNKQMHLLFKNLKGIDWSDLSNKIKVPRLALPMGKLGLPAPEQKEIVKARKPMPEKVEEIEEDDEITDELEEEEEFEEEEIDEDEINDSLDEELEEDEEEFEEEESPFVAKAAEDDRFFAESELVDCLVPKKVSSHAVNPDSDYFEKISISIEDKLKEFHVQAQIINVLKGPVVDTFELELGAGVKVTSVTNKINELSMALMGAPIRMVYPMKGKSTIGIEVPRNPREVIYLDEVLKTEEYRNSTCRLPIAMGKDAYGDASILDLTETPHFLVAGTTGAGKSVFVNTLLVSLIVRLSPKKLKLLLIDPKQLELALYQTLPHLIMPVVTDPNLASAALLWAIEEMERRYTILKDFAVKNIDGYNKKLKTAGPELIAKVSHHFSDEETGGYELPYIVIVVDEFADLVLSKAGKSIENSISRLAAKARASGIHIVLATQRPSTDVITGVIKANFPTRAAFRVTTNMDSRVILDTPGAEKLLGKGDMLFKKGIDTLRMHSAYVDEEEIEALVEKLSGIPAVYSQKAMDFITGANEPEADMMAGEEGEPSLKDDKYEEAVKIVATYRQASASFLQRRLGVGYNRAANLIEEMERQGIVGPAQGSKPRKVLVSPPADS